MKMKQTGMLWLVVLAWAASVPVGLATEERGRTHFVWHYEECIKPDQMETYMKARIADAKLSAEHKFEFPFFTFVDNFRVSTGGIFGAFAQLDAFPQILEAYHEKTGGKSKQLQDQAQKCVSHCSADIAVFRPDLSYQPESPAFTPDFSQPFYQSVTVYYVKPDQYEQAQEAAKKIKQMHEQKKTSMSYWVYERLCGEGVPAFVGLMSAKDKVQFVTLEKNMQEKVGDDYAKIMTENRRVLTKIETMEGTYVPEASYVPEGTF